MNTLDTMSHFHWRRWGRALFVGRQGASEESVFLLFWKYQESGCLEHFLEHILSCFCYANTHQAVWPGQSFGFLVNASTGNGIGTDIATIFSLALSCDRSYLIQYCPNIKLIYIDIDINTYWYISGYIINPLLPTSWHFGDDLGTTNLKML